MIDTLPYPNAIERFPTLRQSRLATFDRCALSASFDERYENSWTSIAQARGQIFHRWAAKVLKQLSEMQERVLPTDLAIAILHECLRQHDIDQECPTCSHEIVKNQGGRIVCALGHEHSSDFVNLPFEEIKDLRWVVIKFAHENAFDIENLVDIEHRLRARVSYPHPDGGTVERVLTGVLDAMFVTGEDDTEAVVLDWKDTWDLPAPTEVGFDGYFQQRFYAWLVMKNYEQIQKVTLREHYVRRSEYREATVWRADLEDVEAELTALAERFDRSFEQENFPASPGRHCFAGETRFLTDQGVRSLRAAVGEQVRVMNRHGEWEDAEVHAFGVQPLLRVTFDDGTTVRATPDHRWWNMKRNRNGGWSQTNERITTAELDRVPITWPLAVAMDEEGIRHGAVYGDGYKRPVPRDACELRLMPQDEHLARFFPKVYRRKDGYLHAASQPGHFKALPTAPTPEYARGFIAGLLAADGHVSKIGTVALYCEGRARAEAIAEIARLGGCVVSSVRLHSDKPTAFSAVGIVTRELMRIQIAPATAPVLRPDHRERLRPRNQMRRLYREVVSVEPDGTEEVFCVVAPGSESFTLASGIATSNCQMCPRPAACPIFPGVRGEGMIDNPEMAARAARELKVAKAVVKQRTTALAAWTSVHGPEEISSHKGRRGFGHREISRTARPTREELEAAISNAGGRPLRRADLERLYVTKKGTRFEEHTLTEVEDTADDAALMSALEQSLEQAR